jgi:MarR family transcriptional regulator, organic hydroperoxide resistance regulator
MSATHETGAETGVETEAETRAETRAETGVEAAQDDPACTSSLPSAARGGPVSHAISRVARLHRAAAGRLLRGAGIYPGQEFVMMLLWEKGALRQADLIKALEVDPSTVTKMLQRLEQTGHVRRRPDPRDGRAVLVEATDRNHGLHDEVAHAWTGLEEHTLAGLSPAERTQLAALLARVETNLCTGRTDCEPPAGD